MEKVIGINYKTTFFNNIDRIIFFIFYSIFFIFGISIIDNIKEEGLKLMTLIVFIFMMMMTYFKFKLRYVYNTKDGPLMVYE